MKRALVLFFFSSVLATLWPDLSLAQTPTPTPAVKLEIRSFIGAYSHDKTREPLVGLRALLDVPTALGVHLVARADALALSDGAAIDQNLSNIPSFRSGEGFVALYRPVAGAISIECAAGAAMSFERGEAVERKTPRIWGCGLGYHAGDTRITVLVGGHEATGTGTRVLGSVTLPVRGQTAMQIDGAGGGAGGWMVRSGIGVRF